MIIIKRPNKYTDKKDQKDLKRLDDSKDKYIIAAYLCYKVPIASEKPFKFFTEYQFEPFENQYKNLQGILNKQDDV